MSHGNRTRTKRKLLQQYYAFGTHARSAFGSAPHLEPHSRLFVIFAIFCSEIFLVFSSLKAFPGAAPFSGGEEESFSQKLLTRMMRASSGKKLSKFLSRSQRSRRQSLRCNGGLREVLLWSSTLAGSRRPRL